jgi:hypothetical protein
MRGWRVRRMHGIGAVVEDAGAGSPAGTARSPSRSGGRLSACRRRSRSSSKAGRGPALRTDRLGAGGAPASAGGEVPGYRRSPPGGGHTAARGVHRKRKCGALRPAPAGSAAAVLRYCAPRQGLIALPAGHQPFEGARQDQITCNPSTTCMHFSLDEQSFWSRLRQCSRSGPALHGRLGSRDGAWVSCCWSEKPSDADKRQAPSKSVGFSKKLTPLSRR